MPPQNARLFLMLPFYKDIVDGLNHFKKKRGRNGRDGFDLFRRHAVFRHAADQ